MMTEQATPQRKARWTPSTWFSTTSIATRMIVRETFRNTRWFIVVAAATVVINLLALATSLFAIQVYDKVVPTLAFDTLWMLVSAMAGVILIDWLLKRLRGRILDQVSTQVDKAISQQVFSHIMHLQLDKRPRSLGTLASQVSGLDNVRHFFSASILFALVDLPFALMFVLFIGLIGGMVGWVYAAMFPLALLLGFVTQQRLHALTQSQLARSNERQGLLVEAIQGAETIRAGNATAQFESRWATLTASINTQSIQQKDINNFGLITSSSLATCAYVLAILVGVYQIAQGNLTMGALIACSILGGRVISPVAQSVNYMAQWQNVAQTLRNLDQLLMLETTSPQEKALASSASTPKQLQLNNLRFAYDHSPLTQLDVKHLSIKAGERVVVLGTIGSGKSTLLKLLAGLYRPSEGDVVLADHAGRQQAPDAMSASIGYLPQTVQLFKGTLQDNLTLGGQAQDNHVQKVCQQLGLDQVADCHPKGMQLTLSEGGEGLSGGQKQLVGLARVCLAAPKIWLLDEPTAALDGRTEKTVLNCLQARMKSDDMLVLSTHRPSIAASIATRVIVMAQGRIVADGTPEAVLGTPPKPAPTQRFRVSPVASAAG